MYFKEHKWNPAQKCLQMSPFGSHFCAKYWFDSVKWDSYLCDKNCYMTPERLHKSYRIATQNQKWLPNGYIKSKVDTKWLHKKGAKW
ncbi:hypothetical protein CTI98_11960 [Staphylococcus epidermidis]|nr:hypothetical protein CTI98_11960 [Staphylococcus epidermidis]